MSDDDEERGRAAKFADNFCALLVDGAFLLSRYCGDPLAAATCLVSQHLFSQQQSESVCDARSSFARRANDMRGDESAAAPALVVRRCHVKRFLVNVRCAEEVKRVIPASRGAGRPKKIRNQEPKTNLVRRK